MANADVSTDAASRLAQLPDRLKTHTDFARVAAVLSQGGRASLEGVWGSACALVTAALLPSPQEVPATGPLLVVLPQIDALDDFVDDLALFTPLKPERFPAWETAPGEQVVHDEIFGDRLRTLKRLAAPQPPEVVVTTIQSLQQPVPDREGLVANTRMLEVGDSLEPADLQSWMASHGFHHTSAVELPGEFSARGGILDVYAPDWLEPVRIEFFGDEIESIRHFDVATQRSGDRLDEVTITMLPSSRQNRSHLAAYLPAGSRVLLVEPEQLKEEGSRYLARLERPQEFHSAPAVLSNLESFASATLVALGGGAATCHLNFESVERFSGDMSKVRDELDRLSHLGDAEDAPGHSGDEVFVICQTEAEIERLGELFAGTQLAQAGRLFFPLGRLRHGFRFVDQRLVLVSGAELFGRADIRRLPRRKVGKAIDSFLDLREGNLVVHLAHGIGRYRGLKMLEKEDHVEEHLEIEFHGGSRIYVPASNIDLVQKYVGGRKARPALAKIGGRSWTRQKQAAEAAVADVAVELLQIQAARRARPGLALAPDTDWQREFDASFPYHETPDQLSAIHAIKNDMQSPRPMDRLLCGDVGFGKTEMAMRAAFKAVDNGYQVAVLVPTTILAEQHYRTFRQRMAEFPFQIARLSRFCTGSEQTEILHGLKEGSIDIVIGTHRLASRDVEFDNLGLLIIDEEQRFGVDVKERLKSLRSTVDVLTLSATPIPRTLNMALVGMRDISNLETPPEDRLAVETRVTRFSDSTIRHAVLRELSRGGQIFFVHNRIHDIEALARKLQDIVPEVRMRIGHGQMNEQELEQVMLDFVAGEFDMLLATTIVESGLDIPNANTIFIDEANRYGLADLHQLRGRVGRYKHRAYCYMLVHPSKHLSPDAAKRLRAIEEFSEMGAGFAIAMRDLEIRGAGNILGTQQSGHIAAVGYELYCELLENAVRRLTRQPPRIKPDVNIELPGEAYLPIEYVDDMRLKIDIYRRIYRLANDDELRQMREELIERFGPLPSPVEHMLALAELRIDAAVWQIDDIRREEKRFLVFGYTQADRARQLVRFNQGRLRLVDERELYLTIPSEVATPAELVELAKSVLRVG